MNHQIGDLVIRRSRTSKRWGLFQWRIRDHGEYVSYPKCGCCPLCPGHPVFERLTFPDWDTIFMGDKTSPQSVIEFAASTNLCNYSIER